MSKILIGGGSGLVGTQLTKLLQHKGIEVVWLGRKAGFYNGVHCYQWDIPNLYIDPAAFDGVTGIVNLAGAGIANYRWTQPYKKELYNSRILSTRLLINEMQQRGLRPDVLVNISATGIYGNTHTPATEETIPASDFLANMCKDWEQEANQWTQSRLVILRLGIVLAAEGGFVQKMAGPIRWYAGAILGNGNQIIPWVHIDDVCEVLCRAIDSVEMSGVYNVVAPNPESNRILTHTMAKLLNRPVLLPGVPKAVLNLLLGEMAGSLVVNQNVSCQKLEQTGYQFMYPHAHKALTQLLTHTN